PAVMEGAGCSDALELNGCRLRGGIPVLGTEVLSTGELFESAVENGGTTGLLSHDDRCEGSCCFLSKAPHGAFPLSLSSRQESRGFCAKCLHRERILLYDGESEFYRELRERRSTQVQSGGKLCP